MHHTAALEHLKKHTALTDLKEVEIEKIWNKNTYSLDTEGNLIGLNLDDNKLTKIDFVAELKTLQILSFSANQVSDISPVKELTNLQKLYFYANQVSDISPVKELTNLQELYFYANQVSDISPVKELTNLQELDFAYNQVSDISPVKELTNLQNLSFRNNQVSDISPVKELTNLQKLYFYANQVSDISPVKELTNLQELYFSANQVSDISPVKELTNLQNLYFSANQVSDISHLKTVLALPKLKYLYAFGNPIAGIPIEKLGKGINDNCLEDLRNYFKQIAEQGTIQVYEAKMILVGEAGTGKTTLRKKLIDPAYPVPNPEDEKNSTHGIEITPAVAFAHSPQAILANIWDFGGQHNYYSTHRYFLTEWALYVLVVDERKENTRYDYWFQIIDLLAKDKKSDQKLPIVLLYNKRSGQPMKYLDLNEYQTKFPDLEVHSIDLDFSESDWGSERLRNLLSRKLAVLGHIGVDVPALWLPIRRELERRRSAEKANYIDRKTFFEICEDEKLKDTEDQLYLSKFLHQIGIILHYQEGSDALARMVILNPDWAVDAVYAALSDREKIKQGCFKFPRQWLIDFWKGKGYKLDEYEAFLNLMFKNQFEIAYEHTDKNKEVWVTVPDLLSAKRPNYDFDKTENLVFRYHYEFMPEGLLTHFIVRMSEFIWEIAGEQMVWKNGVVLDNRKGTQAEIRRLDLEGNRKISFEIRLNGTEKEYFLARIREEFETVNLRFSAKLKPTELIPCNCSECKESETRHLHKYLKLLEWEKDGKKAQCGESGDSIEISPMLKGILDTKKLKYKYLKDLIEKNNMSGFYEELDRLGISENQVSQFKQEFIWDGGDFKYAERLKVWLGERFKKEV